MDGSGGVRVLVYRRVLEEASMLLRKAGVEEPKVGPPKSFRYGEASYSVFELARKLGRNPVELAGEIVGRIKVGEGLVSDVEAAGGYINFKVNWKRYASLIISTILSESEGYGSNDLGRGRHVLVEHTSVNPNKPLHVGHARNICLGDTLYRLLTFLGYKVTVLNYIDDSGSQMADVVMGFTELGYSLEPPQGMRFDEYCGDIVYVKVSAMVDGDPGLAEKRRRIAKAIESGEGRYYEVNRMVVDRVLRDQLKTCWRIGARYDILNMESDILHLDLWSYVFGRLKEGGAAYLAEEGSKKGCWLLDLSGHPRLSKEGDEVLVKSDGTTTYVARDIAYAAWKLGGVEGDFTYHVWGRNPDGTEILVTDREGRLRRPLGMVDLSINVIDVRQTRPQEIVRYALKLLNLPYERYIHYGYEVVALGVKDAVNLGYKPKGGEQMVHMSGRRGLYVKVDALLNMLRDTAAKETRDRHPDWSQEKVWTVAEKIAVGALRYALIKPDPDKLIVLDTSEMMRLEGNTGPYLQYSYARACRILEKADSPPSGNVSGDVGEAEKNLLRMLASFPDVVEEAGRNLSPKTLATYSYKLASEFNNFYERVPVLQAPPDVRKFRLGIVESFRIVLGNAMRILGIPVLEEM